MGIASILDGTVCVVFHNGQLFWDCYVVLGAWFASIWCICQSSILSKHFQLW